MYGRRQFRPVGPFPPSLRNFDSPCSSLLTHLVEGNTLPVPSLFHSLGGVPEVDLRDDCPISTIRNVEPLPSVVHVYNQEPVVARQLFADSVEAHPVLPLNQPLVLACLGMGLLLATSVHVRKFVETDHLRGTFTYQQIKQYAGRITLAKSMESWMIGSCYLHTRWVALDLAEQLWNLVRLNLALVTSRFR